METQNTDVKSNTRLINNYISKYKESKRPIAVSFKKKLKHLNSSDRYTHLIHTYPAKLLMHIPYFFLNNSVFSKKGDYVLDPFCGTGTVLLESILANRKALGADANPLARLIANVKTEKQNYKELRKHLTNIIYRSKKYDFAPIPEVVNINHWFPKKTQKNLAKILKAIKGLKDEKIRSFFLVCFSNCVKKVSYADPRIAVPVKINPERFKDDINKYNGTKKYLKKIEQIDVFDKFKSISLLNIERLNTLNKEVEKKFKAKVISNDARKLTSSIKSKRKLKDNSVQLIITSPPYAGAQKYIRSSSLNLGWTEMADAFELLELDKKNIGRENYKISELEIKLTGINKADSLIKQIFLIDKIRAKIIAQYLIDMKSAIDESIRVLKKGGYFVLIVGNNKVCNKEFNTQKYLTEVVEKKGLTLIFKLIDDIKSYGLMTKRNKTADIISREWVLVFKK
jgi:tRNA G10  N-methylase Trm11